MEVECKEPSSNKSEHQKRLGVKMTCNMRKEKKKTGKVSATANPVLTTLHLYHGEFIDVNEVMTGRSTLFSSDLRQDLKK